MRSLKKMNWKEVNNMKKAKHILYLRRSTESQGNDFRESIEAQMKSLYSMSLSESIKRGIRLKKAKNSLKTGK